MDNVPGRGEAPTKPPRKRAKAKPVEEPQDTVEQSEPIHVNAPFAFVQASQSLQIAEQWALEHKDYGALIDSANSWIEMGRHLLDNGVDLVYDETAGTVAQEDITDQPMGFSIGFGGTDDGADKPEDQPETSG